MIGIKLFSPRTRAQTQTLGWPLVGIIVVLFQCTFGCCCSGPTRVDYHRLVVGGHESGIGEALLVEVAKG